MFKTFVLSAFLVAGAFGACSFPNGTDTKTHWYEVTSEVFKASMVTLEDASGAEQYPVNVIKDIFVEQTISISGSKTYTKLLIDVKVEYYSGSTGCTWHTLPTFGLLDNQDGCDLTGACPFAPGSKTFKSDLPMKKFSPVTSLMDVSKPYRISIRFKDGDTKSVLGTIAVEVKITK